MTHVIIGGRRSGKTTRAVAYAVETGATIVCPTERDATILRCRPDVIAGNVEVLACEPVDRLRGRQVPFVGDGLDFRQLWQVSELGSFHAYTLDADSFETLGRGNP